MVSGLSWLVRRGTRGGATCTNERLPRWTKLSPRADSRAFTASFTRERGTKLPKNVSSSCSSAATTHSRYLESSARERFAD